MTSPINSDIKTVTTDINKVDTSIKSDVTKAETWLNKLEKNKIISKILSILTSIEKLIISNKKIRGIFLSIIGILIIYNFYSCHSDIPSISNTVSVWKDHAASLEKQNSTIINQSIQTQKLADSVIKEANQKQIQVNKLENISKQSKQQTDSLINNLSITIKTDTTVIKNDPKIISDSILYLSHNYDIIIDTLQFSLKLDSTQIYQDKIVIDSQSTNINKLILQNTDLSTLLKSAPLEKPVKILWLFPAPSRKASFLAGGILGVLGTVFIIVK